MKIELLHTDCMTYMAGLPDKAFDLAIVDPPYGIGEGGGAARTRGSKKTNGLKKNWDNQRPTAEYFIELRRVSANQIIWGGNYFADLLPASRCWIYWQKELGGDFADGELAWTSFDKVLRQYKKRSETFDRIHPTQKPVGLYKWLLNNYATCSQCNNTGRIYDDPGGSTNKAEMNCDYCHVAEHGLPKILDTHLGSGSSAIAAHQMGFDFVGCEIDKDYYDAAVKRYNNAIMQQTLFKP